MSQWSPRHFATLINTAMRDAELTQNALAAESGVKAPVISRWRSGQMQPSYDNLLKVAHALGQHGIQDALLADLFDAASWPAPADPGAAPKAPTWFRHLFPGEAWDERYAGIWKTWEGQDDEISGITGEEVAEAMIRTEVERRRQFRSQRLASLLSGGLIGAGHRAQVPSPVR